MQHDDSTLVVINAPGSKFADEHGALVAYVDPDGTVRVFDEVADHRTVCHDLSPGQIERARELAANRRELATARQGA